MAVDLNTILLALDDNDISFTRYGDDCEVDGAEIDSRAVCVGSLFICKGKNFKLSYLAEALIRGAAAIMLDEALHAKAKDQFLLEFPELKQRFLDTPRCVVGDIRRAMAVAASVAWGRPAERLRIIGITGTKGKTTTAVLLSKILKETSGRPVALIGTHMASDGVNTFTSTNTTPEAPELYKILASAAQRGCEYAVMEVSSQALKYERVLGLTFTVGCFLNISPDHISASEHPDFADYYHAKERIFDLSRTLVLNAFPGDVEDALDSLRQALERVKKPRYTFGDMSCCWHGGSGNKPGEASCDNSGVRALFPGKQPDVVCTAHQQEGEYQEMHVAVNGTKTAYELALLGACNRENALAALACCYALSIHEAHIKGSAGKVFKNTQVEGRMNRTVSHDSKLSVYVDYAHNKASYQQFFTTLREISGDAYTIAVFGVCGDRARNRWRDLPETAAVYADYLVLTTDEPDSCDPAELIARMAEHVPNGVPYEEVVNRDVAVQRAVELAYKKLASGCRVALCLLGKGQEDSITISGKKMPYTPDTKRPQQIVDAYNRSMADGSFSGPAGVL